MINWTEGYRSEFYGYYVDPATGRDIERFEITGGDINRTTDDLRASAQFDTINFSGEHWIRLYMDARQSDSGVHIPLFTGLTATPQVKMDGVKVIISVDAYSPLKIDDDILLERGWYAPAGLRTDAIIKQLLTAPFGIDIPEMPSLTDAIIAEGGETRLSMVEKILEATGYNMRVNGYGTVEIFLNSNEPDVRYGLSNDAVEEPVEVEDDYFTAPNVFRAISGDLLAVARDEGTDKLSIPSRGREIWMEDDSVDLADNETIAEYATRRLKEEQNVSKTINYARRYNPDLYPGNVVEMTYDQIRGKYRIVEQTVKLTYNGQTEDKACEV